MERKRPRKLNFNAPLLSTRRPHQIISDKSSCKNSQGGWEYDSGNGIPFCWEQAPGKPKNSNNNNYMDDGETPRPKLPPSRWRPSKFKATIKTNGDDADVDDVFSDDMEVLSLTEAIDIVEKAEKFHGSSSSWDEMKSKSLDASDLEQQSDYCPSPNFIIQRFLPDATALAASSTLNVSKTKIPYLCNYSPSPCVAGAVIKQSLSSPKRCGLEMLLPWRMKHKLCGVKSPIRDVQTKITGSKQKNLFSSIVAPSREGRCE